MLTLQRREARKNGIGGSDAGAILGLSPYKSAVDVYLEKTGSVTEIADNDAIYWGNVLENTVAQEYARRTGAAIMRRNAQFQHPEHRHMLANIDRWVAGQKKILECKTAGQYMADKLGPSGTDLVPDDYLVQCQHYMIVLGVDVCDLAVLIGGRDFRIYTIGLDRELADIIIAREYDFWNNHVIAHVPPAPQSVADIESLYPADDGQTLVASAEIEMAVTELKIVKEQIKKLDGLKGEKELLIKSAMLEKSVLLGIDGAPIATWRKAKDSRAFNKSACEKMHPDIIEQYTVDKPGSRRFLIK